MRTRLTRQLAGLAAAGALVVGATTLATGTVTTAAPSHVSHSRVVEADTHWPCHGCP